MDLSINGKTRITLSPSDFKAAGGEGAVYVKSGTAFKLYGQGDANGKFVFAPKKMIPEGKIQELGTLSAADIIRPQEILRDKGGTAVGYTMRAVPDAVPLCQLFTKSFRDRYHVSPDCALDLVQKLQAGVRHVHERGILIVDLNETNFLVDTGFQHVFFIDVDSYQTAHYPATAIMESVRDRHSRTFSEGTDWFSFALISFQMLVGIHPFKGKHPDLQTLDERMKANVSVLNPAVRVPGACQPISVLPAVYRDWYEAVFERGERVPPPNLLMSVIVASPTITQVPGSDNFLIKKLLTYDGAIIAVVGGNVLTTRGVWAGAHRQGAAPVGAVLGVTPNNHPVIGWLDGDRLRLTDVTRQQEIALDVNVEAIMATGGYIYARQGDMLVEVSLTEMPNRLLASVTVVGNVLGQATQLFEGVAVQSLLGATYLGLLPGGGRFHEIRAPELDGYRIADARFERGVLVAVGQNGQGRYDRFVLRFNDTLTHYDTRDTPDVSPTGVNFAVLDTGIVALLGEDEHLELFAKLPGSPAVKKIGDKGIDGSCHLFARGAQALIARGDALFNITRNTP